MSNGTQTLDGQSPLGVDNAFNLQQTYSYINNNQFYSLVSKEYFQYYNRFIKHYFYWYDGYNPYFHNTDTGMFSTKLASAIVDGLAGHIVGGTLMYDNKTVSENDETLEFARDWVEENDFSNLIEQGVKYSLAGGDSLLRLNYDGKDLWTDVFRKDYYFLDTDFKGNVIDATILLYTETKSKIQQDQKTDTVYYIIERRYFDDNMNPMYEIKVQSLQGDMTMNKEVDISSETIPWESLPKTVRKSIKRNFGDIQVGVPQELIFDGHLGLYLLKNTKAVGFLPSSPFGESVLHNIISHIMSYDYSFSSMMTDQYTGRAKLIVPQGMQAPHGIADNYGYSGNFNSGLDSYMYTMLEMSDPDDQKPIPLQFDTRADEWAKTRDNIIEMAAMNLRISTKTLADFVNNATNVTAQEVHDGNDKTVLFVENKRSLLKIPINKCLNDMLEFYGKKDKVVVKFSKAGLTNINNLATIVAILKQINLIDDTSAMEMLYPDADAKTIASMLSKIPYNIQTEVENEEVKENETDSKDINHVKKVKK